MDKIMRRSSSSAASGGTGSGGSTATGHSKGKMEKIRKTLSRRLSMSMSSKKSSNSSAGISPSEYFTSGTGCWYCCSDSWSSRNIPALFHR